MGIRFNPRTSESIKITLYYNFNDIYIIIDIYKKNIIMEKYDLNEGNEALKRVLLMMKYDNKKTLVENTSLIFEQSEDEYFKNLIKSYMSHPESIPNIFGNPTIKPEVNAKAFFDAISNKMNKTRGITGIARDMDPEQGLPYIIQKTFTSLPNSFAMFKSYPSVGGESLWEAIEGEWFAGDLMDSVINPVKNQLQTWCKDPKNIKNDICIVKTRYGI